MNGSKDRRKIENIIREPLTTHRFWLNGKLRAADDPENPQAFTLDEFKKFIDELPVKNATSQLEAVKVMTAVQTGVISQPPVFNTPETQLIWGAALAFLKVNPEQMSSWATPLPPETQLSQTALWKQIVDTRGAKRITVACASHSRSLA